MTDLEVTVVPTRNRAGYELVEGVRQLMRELLGGSAKVEAPPLMSPLGFLRACWLSSLVVLDGTVEPEGQHNYHLFRGIERQLDHVLIVGRSYLPLNVRGMRAGGAPVYPHFRTNEQILAWLRRQLCDDKDPVRPHRSWREKASLGIRTFLTSSRTDQHRRRERHQLFISYRGRNYSEAKQLRKRIETREFHKEPKSVVMYGPDELALTDELLSPLQRWNVLSVISDVINECEEF